MKRLTFLWHFAATQLAVSWFLGCRNFDGAIRLLNKLQSRLPDDAEAKDVRKGIIAMIAQCHWWAQRNDDALAAAKQVHALDGRNLEANKLLSEIYAKQGEHALAVKHARLALESPPLVAHAPKWMWRLFGWMTSIHPNLRQLATELERTSQGQSEDDVEWHGWAMRYLAWYDASHGAKETPTLH